jgi:hypothetical protein
MTLFSVGWLFLQAPVQRAVGGGELKLEVFWQGNVVRKIETCIAGAKLEDRYLTSTRWFCRYSCLSGCAASSAVLRLAID